MKAVIATKIIPENVNLAMLPAEQVKSDEVIQIRDLSITTRENQLPIFSEARRASVESTGVLNIEIDTLTPQITSEYNFITNTAEYVPLFLKHRLTKRLHNTTAKDRGFEIDDLVEQQEYQFLSSSDQGIIVPNTIKVLQKPGFTVISNVNYIVDLGRRIIIFKTNLATLNGIDILIEFKTISNNIDLYDEFNNKIQQEHFRLHPVKYETFPGAADPFATHDVDRLNFIYDVNVLLANILSPDNTYFAKYTYFDTVTNQSKTHVEVINPESIYQKVPILESFYGPSSYVFTVNPTTFEIATKLTEIWPIVFVKYPANRNSKIALLEPQNIPHDKPWFIEVSNDKFTKDGLTYLPLEKKSQPLINDTYTVETIIENISKLDSRTIKTHYNDLHLLVDNEGNPINIVICNGDNFIEDQIEWVDARRGIIKMRKDFVVDVFDNAIKYQRRIRNILVKDPNINPYMVYNHTNNNITDKLLLYYILPIEEVNQYKYRSIFSVPVYKNPERYEKVPEYQESIGQALTYIAGINGDTGKSNLYDLIPSYLLPDGPDELHPIILGYIGASNVTTPDSIEITDIRRRGGGIPVNTQINELMAEFERHYLDIAKLDGYDYNLSNAAVVRVNISVKLMFMEAMSKYDAYVQRALRLNPNFSIEQYVESFIEVTVRKYLNAAAHLTIQYV